MSQQNGKSKGFYGLRIWAYWDKKEIPHYTLYEFIGVVRSEHATFYRFQHYKKRHFIDFTIDAIESKRLRPFCIGTESIKLLEGPKS